MTKPSYEELRITKHSASPQSADSASDGKRAKAAKETREKIGSRGALDGGSKAIRGSGHSATVYNASARNGTAAKNVCRHCGKPIELAEAPAWVHKNPADWKGERKANRVNIVLDIAKPLRHNKDS